MKITHIEFTKTFPVGVTWEKVMMGADIDGSVEDHIICMKCLREEVEKFHRSSNPQLDELYYPSKYENRIKDAVKWTQAPYETNLNDEFQTVDGLRIPQAYAKGPEKLKVINREYERMEIIMGDCTSLEELSKHKDYVSKHIDLMPFYVNKMRELTKPEANV